jgi:hypothetical protein
MGFPAWYLLVLPVGLLVGVGWKIYQASRR